VVDVLVIQLATEPSLVLSARIRAAVLERGRCDAIERGGLRGPRGSRRLPFLEQLLVGRRNCMASLVSVPTAEPLKTLAAALRDKVSRTPLDCNDDVVFFFFFFFFFLPAAAVIFTWIISLERVEVCSTTRMVLPRAGRVVRRPSVPTGRWLLVPPTRSSAGPPDPEPPTLVPLRMERPASLDDHPGSRAVWSSQVSRSNVAPVESSAWVDDRRCTDIRHLFGSSAAHSRAIDRPGR